MIKGKKLFVNKIKKILLSLLINAKSLKIHEFLIQRIDKWHLAHHTFDWVSFSFVYCFRRGVYAAFVISYPISTNYQIQERKKFRYRIRRDKSLCYYISKHFPISNWKNFRYNFCIMSAPQMNFEILLLLLKVILITVWSLGYRKMTKINYKNKVLTLLIFWITSFLLCSLFDTFYILRIQIKIFLKVW